MKYKTIIVKIEVPWDEYEKAKKALGSLANIKAAIWDWGFEFIENKAGETELLEETGKPYIDGSGDPQRGWDGY